MRGAINFLSSNAGGLGCRNRGRACVGRLGRPPLLVEKSSRGVVFDVRSGLRVLAGADVKGLALR